MAENLLEDADARLVVSRVIVRPLVPQARASALVDQLVDFASEIWWVL